MRGACRSNRTFPKWKSPWMMPGRTVGVEPGADLVDSGDAAHAGPAFELGVGLQLRLPAAHLAFEEVVELAEIGETLGGVVDLRQRGDGVDHLEAHRVARGGVARVPRRHFLARGEAFDRLHQVKGGAQHRFVATGRDEVRMRDGLAFERAEDAGFAAHGLVGVRAQVLGRAAQDVGAAGADELQQDVLGAAAQQMRVFDGAVIERFRVHPVAQGVDGEKGLPVRIAARGIGVLFGHAGCSHGGLFRQPAVAARWQRNFAGGRIGRWISIRFARHTGRTASC
jgi:hypothetical protein